MLHKWTMLRKWLTLGHWVIIEFFLSNPLTSQPSPIFTSLCRKRCRKIVKVRGRRWLTGNTHQLMENGTACRRSEQVQTSKFPALRRGSEHKVPLLNRKLFQLIPVGKGKQVFSNGSSLDISSILQPSLMTRSSHPK